MAESVSVTPTGEFAKIAVKEQNAFLDKILKGDDASIAKVIKQPENFNPVVLYGLSSALFNSGKKEDAAFWFYVGQLRGRSDANKALDMSARAGINALNQKFGGPINQYAMKDISKLKEIVAKAVKFDESTTRNYDPRWISLHGMDVFLKKEKVAFEPESKWETINTKTRNDYYNGFKQAMKKFNKKG
jgi:hypothetical protein